MKKFLSVVVSIAVLCVAVVPTTALAGGSATVVMELTTGKLLYATGEHLRLPMASTTKIMTALLTLEQPELDRQFVVDDTAIMVEGSSMGLQKGDSASLHALAGGMLTASGNDAANAAATRIAGGNEQFAVLMNARAVQLGMVGTQFVTPSGLDDDEHYSSAYDMALLARAALGNPLFAEMCTAKRLTLRFGNPPYDRTLYNHNRLLSLYPAAIGVKTGFTRTAGRCLVSAARVDGVTLIIVTLNVGDDWNVHRGLYNKYFPAVQLLSIDPPNSLVLPVAGGGMLPLRQQGEMTAVSVNSEPPEVRSEVFAPNFLYPPIKSGDIVGKIVYYIGNNSPYELPLVADGDIAPAPPPDRSLWQQLTEWAWEHTG